MVLRVGSTPTRFPTNIYYTPSDNTPLHSKWTLKVQLVTVQAMSERNFGTINLLHKFNCKLAMIFITDILLNL